MKASFGLWIVISASISSAASGPVWPSPDQWWGPAQGDGPKPQQSLSFISEQLGKNLERWIRERQRRPEDQSDFLVIEDNERRAILQLVEDFLKAHLSTLSVADQAELLAALSEPTKVLSQLTLTSSWVKYHCGNTFVDELTRLAQTQATQLKDRGIEPD